MPLNADQLTLLGHLKELRKRIMLALIPILLFSILVYSYYEPFLGFFLTPLRSISPQIHDGNLVVFNLFEGFVVKLRFAFILGAILSFPIIIYQALRFIIPGLKKKERILVFLCVFLGTLLAFFGFYLGYFFILPFSIQFLVSKEFIPTHLDLFLNFNATLFYVLQFLLGTIIVFQFPIILGLLLKTRILKRAQLWRLSRYIVVLILVLSAIVTPPDIVSQVMVALPMIGLYFITLGFAYIFRWG